MLLEYELFIGWALLIVASLVVTVVLVISRPKARKTFLILGIAGTLSLSMPWYYFYYYNSCRYSLDTWVLDAPIALNEFYLVREEIMANPKFSAAFTRDGFLFLSSADTSKIANNDVPVLKNWFRKGRGYISFERGDISFQFRDCTSYGRHSASGYIYSKEARLHDNTHYKGGVKIVDSVSLNDGWYAHIITCTGCDD